MNIENLHDLLVHELGCKYILGEKVFEAKISQSISLPIEKIG